MKIDFMFNTFIRNNIVDFNIRDYVDFLKHFTIPEEDEENIWPINNYPLIVITL